LNEREFEEFVERNPEEALRLIVKAFKPRELLKVGNRSYVDAFKYPESRFDAEDLMPDGGGSLQVLNNPDMLQPLSDPGKLFTDKYVIPPSSLIFQWGDRIYDKKWWGELAGGLTDASTAIQSAIKALPNGGKIFIKEGVYKLSNFLYIGTTNNVDAIPNITLEGEGIDKTILKATTLGQDSIIRATGGSAYRDLNLHVRDLTLDGDGKSQWCVSIGTHDRIYFERVKMMNKNGKGLYFQQPSPLHTIPFTYVYEHQFIDCIFDGVDKSQTGDAVDFTYVVDLLVERCLFKNCGANAFDALNCPRAVFRNVVSHDNGCGGAIEGGCDWLIDGMRSYKNSGRGLLCYTPV